MAYHIEPGQFGDGMQLVRWDREATVVLVGCGGTGGFLAEAVCRLLLGRSAQLCLIDPDRVEPHNVARQAFDRTDVGRFKAEVLAERLARRFGREVGYSVLPYDAELHAQTFGDGRSRLNLLVGCVDNGAARRALVATLDERRWSYAHHRSPQAVWWLDCGNGRNSGQVLLGNATRPEALRGAFVASDELCRALPAPSLQRPDLLDAPPEPRPLPDCAEAVASGDQGPTVNQVVAALAASYVEKLLAGTCRWMASYFDLYDGMLRCVPAEPKTVAAIADLRVNAVVPRTQRT
ncbi:MAG: ThiF family adenylyltransferase [Dehalococcoidia bacterium]